MMKRVVIFQRITATYRIAFYKLLKNILAQRGIDLLVVYGQPSKFELGERIPEFNAGRRVNNRYLYLRNNFIVWQPIMQHLRNADLIILQQSNRILSNSILMLFKNIFFYKVAFWGHGCNFQAVNRNSIAERVKRFSSSHVSHWFAYNDLAKKIVMDFGYPEEKITSVNNSIDTQENIELFDSISKHELEELKQRYAIDDNAPVGIFCSRLYQDKRVDFLIRCVEEVKKRTENFHFFLIGDGVESSIVKEYAGNNMSWFHWVGAKYGREKVRFFKLADFQFMPGFVGLHVVESFALLTPLITTDIEYHGPEIIYLENGTNGIMTKNTQESYVNEIIHLIQDNAYRKKLIEGCRQAREFYTIENMAARFADGICKELL